MSACRRSVRRMSRLECCPRDGTRLEERRAGPASFGVCPTCQGFAVSGEDLRHYLEAQTDFWKLPLAPRADALPPSDDGVLCACGRAMDQVLQEGVRIDRCWACGAIWLDGGELATLMERTPPVGFRNVAPSKVGTAEAVMEILLYGLHASPWG